MLIPLTEAAFCFPLEVIQTDELTSTLRQTAFLASFIPHPSFSSKWHQFIAWLPEGEDAIVVVPAIFSVRILKRNENNYRNNTKRMLINNTKLNKSRNT